ncbi:Ig-like domain-containing protein [uncultured Draconibacterium sp.]|uniref:DUF7507 domain-containing protein n=1 Tax=uncultured Draconibacterium sp. TaxID=1573823 RepID=UPI0029C8CD52|nr:Ig-like domain-containing protein [uncultured Draconibacterium sp.]
MKNTSSSTMANKVLEGINYLILFFLVFGISFTANAKKQTLTNEVQSPYILLNILPEQSTYSYVGEVISFHLVPTNISSLTINDVALLIPFSGTTNYIGTLQAGEQDSTLITYTITQADIDNGSLTISTRVTGVSIGGLNVYANGTITLEAENRAHTFDLVKTALQTEYSALDTILYRFKISNIGNTSLNEVFLIDSVLNITKSFPNMAPVDVYVDTIPYIITQADLDNGSITNIAKVVGRVGNNGLIVTASDTCTINAVRRSAIALEKTADYYTYNNETQIITYTFSVTNTGNVTLINATITDPLTSTNYNLGTIAPKQTRNYYATYNISQVDLDDGSVTNIAEVNATTLFGDPVNDSDTVVITAVQNASLSLNKDVEEPYYSAAGDTLHYSVIVRNSGNVTLTDIQVTDPMTGISSTLPILVPGESDTMKAIYVILQADVDAGSIVNTATGSARDPNNQLLNETTQTTIEALRFPFLNLTKTSDKLRYDSVGTTIGYQIVVENTGNVTIFDAEVTDPMIGLSDTITELSPGQVETYDFLYTVTQADIDSGKILNTATIAGVDALGNQALASDDCTVLALQASFIEISKTVFPQIVEFAGDKVMYYFEISNSGNISLSNVVLDDPKISYSNSIPALLPGETWLDSAQYSITQTDIDDLRSTNTATVTANTPSESVISASDGAKFTIKNAGAIEVVKTSLTNTYSLPGQQLDFEIEVHNIGDVDLAEVVLTDSLTGETWNIGDLPVGSSQLVSTQYTVTQADINQGEVLNRAQASGIENAPTARSVSSEDVVQVKAYIKGGIELVKTSNISTYYSSVGEQIDYGLQFTNSGNVTLYDIVVTDTLTGLVQQFDSLAPGAIQSITTTHYVTQANMDRGNLINTATISALTPNDETVNDEASKHLYAYQSPVLTVTKTADREFYSAAGEIVSYTVLVENSGDVTLTNVEVTDTYIGLSENIASMAHGIAQSFTKKYAVTQTDVDAGELYNFVIVRATAPSRNFIVEAADLTLPGIQSPEIEITKTSDDVSYNSVGDVLNYSLSVKNTGNVSLSNVSVADPLTGMYQVFQNLAPGSDSTLHTSYTIKQADLDVGKIVNIASANGSDPGLAKVNNSDTLIIYADQIQLISLTKAALQSDYEFVDDWIDYTLEVKNIGNVTLYDVKLRDPLTGLNVTYPELAPSVARTSVNGYFVDQQDMDRGEIVNVAEVSAIGPDSTGLGTKDSVKVVALQAASIDLNKTARPNIVENLGDVVNYKFTIANTGNVTLSDINLYDAKIPYNRNIPQLASGEIWSDSINYIVSQADIDGVLLVNQAKVSAMSPDSLSITDSDRAYVAIKQNGAIELEKSCLDITYRAPGDQVRFDIYVTNIGNVTLKDVVVTDSITGQTWNIDSMLPGAVSEYLSTYDVTQNDIDRGRIVNVSKVEAREATPLNRLVVSQDSAFSTALRGPALELTKTASALTYNTVGQVISYTLEAKNIGNVTLTDITVIDTLTGINQYYPTLAPKTSETISIDYLITKQDLDRGMLINMATMVGNDGLSTLPRNTLSLSDSSSVVIYALQEPGILLEKKSDKLTFRTVGEPITYTLIATNAGNVTLENITFTDPLTGLNRNIGSLPEGESDSVIVIYNITLDDIYQTFVTNTATVTGSDPSGRLVFDTDEETVVVDNVADIVITKTVDNPTPDEGGTVVFTVEVTNNGPAQVTNLVVSDTLPAGLTLVDATPSEGTWNNPDWTVGTLALGETVSIDITATIDVGTGGSTITNTADHTQDQADTNITPDDTGESIMVGNVADLVTNKTLLSGEPTPAEGDVVSYLIEVTNNGSAQATNISLTDQLPVGLTATANNGQVSAGVYDSGTGLWTIDTLDNAETATLTLEGTVDAGTGADTITNITTSATTPDQVDTTDSGDNTEVEIVINNDADIVIKKTVDNPKPDEGSNVVFTVEVTNNGPAQVNNLEVSDVLPAGLSYVSATPSTGSWSNPVWSVGTLANGESQTINITASVDAGTGGSTLTNTASNTQDQTDTDATPDDPSASIRINNLADLVINKTVDKVIHTEHDTVIYTVEVTNNGPARITNLVVTDNIPAGLTYLSGTTATGTWSNPDWTIAALDNGATATLELKATVDIGTKGIVINTVSHSMDQEDSNESSDNPRAVIYVPGLTSLVTQKTLLSGDTLPAEGEVVRYGIIVVNDGPSQATNVNLSDNLPDGLTATTNSGQVSQGTYDVVSGLWTIGTLDLRSYAILVLEGIVDIGTGGDTITNITTAATAEQPDIPISGDNLEVTVVVDNQADLITNKTLASGDPTPAEGDVVTYVIEVTNNGKAQSTNISLTDELPEGLTATANNGVVTHGAYNPGTGLWTIDTLNNGETATLTLEGTVDAGTGADTITNIASIATTLDQIDTTDSGDNTEVEIVIDNESDLVISKTVNNPTPDEGSTVVFTIEVVNNGPAQVSNLVVNDTLPEGLTLISATPSKGTWSASAWTVDTLDAEETVTIDITAMVDPGTGGSTITNTVDHTQDQTDTDETPDDPGESITINNDADIVITKTVDNASPDEGSTVVFTVEVTNNGPAQVNNLRVNDVLPSGLSYVSATPSNGSWSYPDWTIGTLAYGESVTLTITATVDVGTGGSTITNTASHTQDQIDSNKTADDPSESIRVNNLADLVINKTADKLIHFEQDTVIYTVEVTNNGPARVTNLVVIDSIPAGLSYVSGTTSTGVWSNPDWTIGTLGNGETATLELKATVDIGTRGILVNTVSHTMDQEDFKQSRDNSRAIIYVAGLTSLLTQKTLVSGDTLPAEGEIVRYEIFVVNDGRTQATNVTLTDQLPDGLTATANNGQVSQGSYDAVSGLWTVGSLDIVSYATLILEGTVDIGTGGDTITNITTAATAEQPDIPISGGNLEVTVVVDNHADLITNKTLASGDPTPAEGDVVTYEIEVTNKGKAQSTNISLTDELPAGLTATANNGQVTHGIYTTGTGLWEIDTLDNGETATLILEGTVNEGTKGDTITNITTAAVGDQPDPNNYEDDLEESIIVAGYNPSNTTVAVEDSLSVEMDGELVGDVSENDYDPEGDNQSFTVLDSTLNGTVTMDSSGKFVYVPDPGFTGDDSFVYEVCDDGVPMACDTANVHIVVEEPVVPNTPPVAVTDSFVIFNNSPLGGFVITNDYDPDGDEIALNLTPLTQAVQGDVTFREDGMFTYIPTVMQFAGIDSFTYQICDNGTPSLCDTGLVIITVTDSDIDGKPDDIDIDDDNDGIVDIDEGDGTLDTNGDGLPDSYDIDADGDGIPDNIEGQPEGQYREPGGIDADDDGLDDEYDPDRGGTAIVPVDTDSDGISDYLDLDSDDDGVPDNIEGHDANADGLADNQSSGYDDDGDGLDDAFDNFELKSNSNGTNAPLQDFDSDGIRDWRDTDDDGDGFLTADEDGNNDGIFSNDDWDGDGHPDYLDADTDCELFIPDGFSPNDDNIYDYFVVECIDQYPDANLQVYNRWGNIVFEKDNYGNEQRWGAEDAWWDGRSTHGLTVGSEKLPPGTYIYILDLKDGSEPRTGTVYINY